MPLIRFVLFHLLRRWATEFKLCVDDVEAYGCGFGWQLPVIGDVCRVRDGRRMYRW